MIVLFNSESIEVNESMSSNYAAANSISLEQAVSDCFGDFRTFENIERELRATLGRWPTPEEIELCNPVYLE